jgi:hypothetical protein
VTGLTAGGLEVDDQLAKAKGYRLGQFVPVTGGGTVYLEACGTAPPEAVVEGVALGLTQGSTVGDALDAVGESLGDALGDALGSTEGEVLGVGDARSVVLADGVGSGVGLEDGLEEGLCGRHAGGGEDTGGEATGDVAVGHAPGGEPVDALADGPDAGKPQLRTGRAVAAVAMVPIVVTGVKLPPSV